MEGDNLIRTKHRTGDHKIRQQTNYTQEQRRDENTNQKQNMSMWGLSPWEPRYKEGNHDSTISVLHHHDPTNSDAQFLLNYTEKIILVSSKVS